MGKPLDPGPPLTPEPEFCECEPPSGLEYTKAVGMAGAAILLGGLGWFGVVLATQRLWGITTVLIGVVTGWVIHLAAGRHRSVGLGVIASLASVFAALTGYCLLWLPFVENIGVIRRLFWYDIIMAVFGAFMAYRLAGPKAKAKDKSM